MAQPGRMDEELREDIAQELLLFFDLEEGAGSDNPDALREKFLGISKRIPEISAKTGIPEKTLIDFCWEMVAVINEANETSAAS